MAADTRVSQRRWVIAGLIAYGLAVAVVVLLPVGYGAVVNGITEWVHTALGVSSFGSGWIEFTANILMFAPLGFLLTLLLRHHWYGVVLALVLSAGAEVAQFVIPSREPSLRDILGNVLGAAFGAALAWLLVLRREHRGRSAAASDSRS